MGLINYKDIDFKQSINKENKIINFNGSEIQIVNYLSIADKYDLIEAAIKKSYEDEKYNPIKLDMYFNLNLIYMYTNIVFNTGDRADEVELYDILKNSGLIDAVKDLIPAQELKYLEEKFVQTLQVYEKYNSNVTGFLSTILNDAISKVGKGIEALQNINPEILEEVKTKYPQIENMFTFVNKE